MWKRPWDFSQKRGIGRGAASNGWGRGWSTSEKICTHCGCTNPTTTYCWDLHRRPSANTISLEDNPVVPTEEVNLRNDISLSRSDFDSLVQLIYERISQMEKPSFYSTALVQTSLLNSLLVSFDANPWIMDSGATDHMTGTSTKFLFLLSISSTHFSRTCWWCYN